MYNNIFFSEAVPSDGPTCVVASGLSASAAADAVSDAAALVSMNHDLQSAVQLNTADIPGMHTLASCLITFLGRRMLAQSVIPGILSGSASTQHVYGSIDGGQTAVVEAEYVDAMNAVGARLHIARRRMTPSGLLAGAPAMPCVARSRADASPCELVGPVEAKGVLGADQRFYTMDFVRCAPRDANYYDKCVKSMEAAGSVVRDAAGGIDWALVEPGAPSALLRPELLQSLVDVAASLATGDTSGASACPERPSWLPVDIVLPRPLEFNVNVFTSFSRLFDREQVSSDEKVARVAAAYLVQVRAIACALRVLLLIQPAVQCVVPAMSFALVRGSVAPLDGDALVRLSGSIAG